MASENESFATTQPNIGSLKDEFTAALPAGFRCKVRYVYTTPKRCDPLFSTPPGDEPEITRLATHFLTITIDPTIESEKNSTDVFVLGIEVLVYSTKHLTTVFVSKADSTGYLLRQRPSAAKIIFTTFMRWLARKEQLKHPTRRLVISLFARSQSQYLFPGSAENSQKHILDDRQLIKWWVRVLDPIFPKQNDYQSFSETRNFEYDGYLTVPGYEGLSELRPFLVPPNGSVGLGQHWHPGNPLKELAQTRGLPDGAPTRCLLPRFPDDPKARFMQDLDDEAGIAEHSQVNASPAKRKGGKWTSIQDLERFWEAMGFRQECSSGRLVGFIWLVVRPILNPTTEPAGPGEILNTVALSSDPIADEKSPSAKGNNSRKQRKKLLSGPIVTRQPRLKGGSSSLTASDLNGMLEVEAGDGLTLTQDGYDKAMHTLLHLDFANVEVARQSTSKWISAVRQICGVQTDWAFEITGTAKYEDAARDASSNGHLKVNEVNDLGGMVRKKRKAEGQPISENNATSDTPVQTAGHEQPVVNVLGTGMVRKKPKPAVG